ncbi:hypothetical protein B0H16DRAFT_1475612 [Mycena metata]|uniref:Uncharacterized protein n=1 Tax=Mycena metata TaxID=1033252 RepID=A0AAD7HDK7_9AGAR|nr:hypothetical protein B0H16DRAFT_1475612 [Mycena metata]
MAFTSLTYTFTMRMMTFTLKDLPSSAVPSRKNCSFRSTVDPYGRWPTFTTTLQIEDPSPKYPTCPVPPRALRSGIYVINFRHNTQFIQAIGPTAFRYTIGYWSAISFCLGRCTMCNFRRHLALQFLNYIPLVVAKHLGVFTRAQAAGVQTPLRYRQRQRQKNKRTSAEYTIPYPNPTSPWTIQFFPSARTETEHLKRWIGLL